MAIRVAITRNLNAQPDLKCLRHKSRKTRRYGYIILISIGVFGIGLAVLKYPHLLSFIRYLGVLFLVSYGLMSLRNIFRSTYLQVDNSAPPPSVWWILLTLLGVSILNPHVYLDTVFLIGSLGSGYDRLGKILFIAGSSIASALWFFSLGYGGKKLSPVLSKAHSWKIINGVTALIMFAMALSLIRVKLHT